MATASATCRASSTSSTTSPALAWMRSGSRRSSSRRWPTSATTSPTTATSIRCSARSPTSTACWRRPTRLGLKVMIDQVLSHTSVEHEWFRQSRREPRQSQGRLVRVGRREARWHPAQQLDVDVRRRGLAVGAATRPVLPAQLPGLATRSQLPQPGGATGELDNVEFWLRTRRRRFATGRDQLLLPRRAAARQPAQAAGKADGSRLQSRQSLCIPVPPLQQHAAREPRLPGRPAHLDRQLSGWHHAGRDLLGGFAGDHGRIRQRPAPAHGLQLRVADRRFYRRLHPRHRRGPGSEDGRRLAVLGDLQP